ncbi:hypothetical protein BCR44DRAFT_34547 [Catenaria anguillulae PL171]|uniref:Uncharacterized protein n=1 Tax=Catenaria anguillulae PL171 TaxID=765915 RepID=A0A1Y2I4P6_9FUNG|nr:hypothetical protein BCR44DRAFT_34547 [Catenaria anguillulae PL171]
MDWGRKQVDITSDVENIFEQGHIAIVPFSDLTSLSLDEQHKWTIRRAEITTEMGKAAALGTPERARTRLGIRVNGADRIFDLSQPNQVTAAAVSFITTDVGQSHDMLERRHIRAQSNCSQLVWVGTNPENTYMFSSQVQRAVNQLLQFGAYGPWVGLTEFVASNSMFLTMDNASNVLAQLANAMPNLVSLELRNLRVPLDFLLANLDCFLRRPAYRGTLLQSVYLTAITLHRTDPPLSTASYSLPAANTTARTKLDSTRPTRNHLRSLSLEVEGRGPHQLAHYECPTVAIHPGLLHGIENIYLKLVKLAVMPPHLANPNAPSFLPLSAFLCDPKVTKRTPLTLEHLTLPNLIRLETCTHSFAPLGFRSAHPPYRIPSSLPNAPNLAHLLLISTDTKHVSFYAPNVLPTLLRYPRLVRARIAYTELAEADLQQIVRQVLSPPKAFGWPGARLRNLIIDNLNVDQFDRNGEPGMRGQLVSVPHLTDLLDAYPDAWTGIAKVAFAHTAVEADLSGRLPRGSGAGAGASTTQYRDGSRVKRDTCPKCDLVVDMFGAGQMDALAGMLGGMSMMVPGMHEAMMQMGLAGAAGSSALIMCPMCSPRESGRVDMDGSCGGMVKGYRKAEVSMWCREGTRHERVI